MKKLLCVAIASLLLSGCAINLPFNNRLSYAAIKEIKQNTKQSNQHLNIQWQPDSFPTRVDVQGASGFVGGGTRTRIPTGTGLAARIEEAISIYAPPGKNGKILTITVNNAKSKFEYSASIFNITPAIDVADVTFDASFNLDGDIWSKKYQSRIKDPTIGARSATGVVENAWDDIAIQVANDVEQHLKAAE